MKRPEIMRPDGVLGNRNGTKRLWKHAKIGSSANFAAAVWLYGHEAAMRRCGIGTHVLDANQANLDVFSGETASTNSVEAF